MSYILDALRRAQTERERGLVPGLDAQLALPAAGPAGVRWRPVGGFAALLLVVAAVLAWLAWWPRPPTPAALPQPAVAVAPVAPTPAPAGAPLAEPERAPLPVVVSAPSAAPAPPVAAPVPPAAVPPGASAAVPVSALPPELRRDWPALQIGGSIWSDDARGRLVIINGQVVREGDAAAPGLRLERINQRSVWLRWRERLVEVTL